MTLLPVIEMVSRQLRWSGIPGSAVVVQQLKTAGINASYSERGIFVPGLQRDYGLYNLLLYHATPKVDVNFRTEWYDDVDGRNYPGGTGFRNNYEEVTLGLDYHPYKWLEVRPEARGDFANNRPAFGPVGGELNRSQFTAAIEWLIKF